MLSFLLKCLKERLMLRPFLKCLKKESEHISKEKWPHNRSHTWLEKFWFRTGIGGGMSNSCWNRQRRKIGVSICTVVLGMQVNWAPAARAPPNFALAGKGFCSAQLLANAKDRRPQSCRARGDATKKKWKKIKIKKIAAAAALQSFLQMRKSIVLKIVAFVYVYIYICILYIYIYIYCCEAYVHISMEAIRQIRSNNI